MDTDAADTAETGDPPFHGNDDAAEAAEGVSLGRHGAPALRTAKIVHTGAGAWFD